MRIGDLRPTMKPEAFGDEPPPEMEDLKVDGLGPVDDEMVFGIFTDSDQDSFDESEDVMPMKGCSKRRKRQLQKVLQDSKIKDFLQRFHFSSDLNKSRSFINEDLQPVHLAAKFGDHQLLRLLLRAGAEPDQKTSLGRTALMIAQGANRQGSHDQIIALLKNKTQIICASDLLKKRTHIICASDLSLLEV